LATDAGLFVFILVMAIRIARTLHETTFLYHIVVIVL